ncbi:serine hydrolase domain-containing protein [Bowmanella dokdonensis]|uniref:Beta-lactamase family protein n=1 Tax=Bowmanella dokdonensis TaxID=751969 RepID=A0A939DPY0_9ALTE|nr:serine hydrolase domain-containing protein [Bowmanella dokdonensis]MBN7826804.1 beta-lactamase family protein [Bowmanella dokdonensis]
MTKGWVAILAAVTLISCSRADDREQQVDRLFAGYQGDKPGASVLVVQEGQAVLVKSYGMADLERGIKVTPETNFRLASISKQFTATAVMMLVEQGKLHLEDNLTQLFPGFPGYGAEITLRHLLQHNSGLIDYESLIPEDFTGQVSDRDALRMMKETDHTYFKPGTQYRYSNTAYAMLAVLVEERSGQPFAEFLDSHIFTPVGMDSTVAYQKGISEVPHRAYGYLVEQDNVSFSDQSTTSAVLGDGGIYSSVLDYFKWDQALYTERLLSRTSLASMWTGNFGDYGFGWRVDTHKGHRRLHHDGSTSGFRNYVLRYPQQQTTVLVLTNRRGPDVMPLAEQVAGLYLP